MCVGVCAFACMHVCMYVGMYVMYVHAHVRHFAKKVCSDLQTLCEGSQTICEAHLHITSWCKFNSVYICLLLHITMFINRS